MVGCSPRPVEFARHWENIDLDADGLWTQTEAKEAEAENPKVRSILLFDDFLSRLKKDDERSGTSYWAAKTDHFQVIPKAAYIPGETSQGSTTSSGGGDHAGSTTLLMQDMTRLCGLVDHRLCSNLELSGVLTDIFPAVAKPFHRISRCQDIVQGECDFFGGEMYRTYQVYHKELCGDYQVSICS